MKLTRLLLLLASLGMSLVACQPATPGPASLTATAQANPTVVIFPTPTKEEDLEYETDTPDETATPPPTTAPTVAPSPQPPSGDVPDILARSAEASAKMPERGIHMQILDAKGNVTFNTIVEFEPPDRVRRWQGVSDQWQDAITIGGKSWVRGYVDGKDTGWVTAEGLEDPVADAMLDSFRNPTDARGADSAVLEEAMKALGLTNPRWEYRFIGPDLMEKRPAWLYEQVCYDGDRLVITTRTWLGQEDLLIYRSETRMNIPNASEVMAYFSNMRVTYWYEVDLEPPIP
jgi:hypothetical protein